MKNIIKGFYITLKERNFVYKLFGFYVITYIIMYLFLKAALKPLDYFENIGNSLKTFNFTYLLLIFKKHSEIGTLTVSLLLSFFLIYFFFSQYILKGFTEKITESSISLKNYRKILLSWLYFIPVFVIAIMIPIKLYMKSRELITISPITSSILYYIFLFLLPVLLIYVLAIFDTTRINSVYKNSNSLKEFFKSFIFALKKYPLFFLIYLVYGLINIAIFLIYKTFIGFLGNQVWKVSLILLFFHLLYLLFQLFVKFSIYSSEFQLIKSKEIIKTEKKEEKTEQAETQTE